MAETSKTPAGSATAHVALFSVERPAGKKIREGQVVFATAVTGANIVRDMREMITNTLGGEMRQYEKVLDATIERALAKLRNKAAEAGYDGIVGLRIVHPSIVDGGLEVVTYGTGFYYEGQAPTS